MILKKRFLKWKIILSFHLKLKPHGPQVLVGESTVADCKMNMTASSQ